jgi:hypothetical protein
MTPSTESTHSVAAREITRVCRGVRCSCGRRFASMGHWYEHANYERVSAQPSSSR